MSDRPDIAERIGVAINQLDIDFSRLTLVGWFVSILSFCAGGAVAYFACSAMIRRNGINLAAGMVFCFTIIAVTTIVFLALRNGLGFAGLAITRSSIAPSDGQNANIDTLKRMADSGMDMEAVQTIDFWHLFQTRKGAEEMARDARNKSFNVVSVEPNDEAGGYDVQIQVKLVPTYSAITSTEQTLASIAEQHGGHADGWGVMQEQ